MKTTMFGRSILLLLLLCLPGLVIAQEATSKMQEQVARNQEAAARNQEASARLAEETASENPEALARVQDAARRAQEAANRAQEAANKAQDAANKDAASSAAQTAASNAQDNANRAQEAANRAQELANRSLKAHAAGPREAAPATNDVVATPLIVVASPSSMSSTAGGSEKPGVAPGAITKAQTSPPAAGAPDFNEFLNRRFDSVIKTRIGPKNNSNQNESPSVSANSTSLVERSSVSDLLSFALNPSGTTANASDDKPTSASMTISAYAFKAFASGRDPLDPSFYGPNRNWRKLSFTYGYDYTKGKEGDPREKGNIYGIKYLPYDKRDISDPSNQTSLRGISQLFSESGPSAARSVARIKRELFTAISAKGKLQELFNASVTKGRITAADAISTDENDRFDTFIEILADDDIVSRLSSAIGGEEALIKLVDNIVEQNIDPEVKFTKTEQELFDSIRRRPQVAISFLTKQRQQTRPNEYMGGLTMDLGVAKRWNLTFNGMINYTDNKLTSDSRGGTFATELQVPLNVIDQLTDRVPWTFSFAASGNWMTNQQPIYQGQAKLVIPFPQLPGLELPISVSFASRSDLLQGKESKIRGKIGFTFDIARLLTAFKNQLGILKVP